MTKDTFQILADEITLIRKDIERLQRTSLNKDEAKNLNEVLVKSLDRMSKVGPTLEQEIKRTLAQVTLDVRNRAVEAASGAAREAIEKSHAESIAAARGLSKAAGEARREAWRYFGGFWVWLASVGAVGLVLGLLLMRWIDGTVSAQDFGRDYSAKYFCGSAGGTEISSEKGRKYCAIPMEPEIK